MVWTDSHLHQFEDGKTNYTMPTEDDWSPGIDYSNLVIGKFLKKKGDTLVYKYDFDSDYFDIVEINEFL